MSGNLNEWYNIYQEGKPFLKGMREDLLKSNGAKGVKKLKLSKLIAQRN